MADPRGGAALYSKAEQPVPSLTQRRPRVREVSSRFMSPLAQSNSTPIANPTGLPRSKSARNRQSPSVIDENLAPEVNRSFEKPSGSTLSTVQRKLHLQRAKPHHHPDVRVSARPDTPVAMGTDRIVSSRYRQVPNSLPRSNSLNSSSNGCAAVTSAARLLQEATTDVQKRLFKISTSRRDDTDTCTTPGASPSASASNQGISSSCPNSPLCVPSTKLRVVHDIRSSMPDVAKWLSDRNYCNAVKNGSDCARSLNFSSSAKMGSGISLPPHPTYIRSGLDPKKGRKVPNQIEDVHCLKMLNNHNLQWRFAIAKAGASFDSQKQEAERSFLSLGPKISDMRDNVQKKRNELAVLRRIKMLTTIVEAQMPYLDEWDTLDKDYSTSLLGTTNALLNSSARLPVSGNVRADVGELEEALGSALKAVEMIGSQIQRFMPKTEELDTSVSELVRMVGGERALIEECGDLMSKTCVSQAKECSLRSTLIQVSNINRRRKQKSEDDIVKS